MAATLGKLRLLIQNRLERTLWQQLRPDWQLPSGLRVSVRSRAEWIIYNDIFVDGEYDDAIDPVIEQAGPNPLILDIGANVGYFGLRFTDRWLRKRPGEPFQLVGIEGAPDVYATLKARMAQPQLADFAHYHLGLAGKRSGEGHITRTDFHVTNSIMQKGARSASPVPFLDIEALLDPNQRIALLKCDIEGAEELLLENYPQLLERTDCAVFELHPTLCDTERCAQLLKEAGLSRVSRLRDCQPDFCVDLFARP